MRTTVRPRLSRHAIPACLAALGLTLTACSGGVDQAPKDSTTAAAAASSPAAASTSAPASPSGSATGSGSATSDEVEEPTSSATDADATGGVGDERPAVLPAALFEEGGMTAQEFAASPDGARVLDMSQASSFQEALGNGSAEVTYSAEPDTAYWVHVLCPERATGGAEVHQTAGGGEKRVAWSEWCGLTAQPPVTGTAQPQTLRAAAEDGGPIRIVVIGTPAD